MTTETTDPASGQSGVFKAEVLPEDARSAVAGFVNESGELNVESLAGGYMHLAKKLGGDKIPVPGEHADATEWASVYDKLGRPKTPDEYELPSMPEGIQLEDEFVKGLRGAAHERGLNQQQLSGLLEFYGEHAQKALARLGEQSTQQRTEVENKLRTEWGDAYDANRKLASTAVAQLTDEADRAFFDEGLGNDPRTVRLFANLGKKLLESPIEGGNRPGNFALAPDQARARITEIQSDLKGPYYNQKHPGHAAAVKEMEQLHASAYPQPQQ